MNDLFDKIYLINLASRTDRYDAMMELFEVIGVTDFELIRPLDASSFADSGSALKTTMQSCKEAHLRIYQDAIDNEYSKIMIFEDDCVFNTDDSSIKEDIDYHLNRCADFISNNDFDLFYYDNIFVAKKRNLIMESFVRLQTGEEFQKFRGKPFSHSYAVSGDFLQELIDYSNSNDYNIDKDMRLIDGTKYFYTRGIFDQALGVKTDNNWNTTK